MEKHKSVESGGAMKRRLANVVVGLLAATVVLRFAYAVVEGTVQLAANQWLGVAVLLVGSGWLAVVVAKWELRERPTKLALPEMVMAAATAGLGYTMAVPVPPEPGGWIRFGLIVILFVASSLRKRMETAPLHDDVDQARPA